MKIQLGVYFAAFSAIKPEIELMNKKDFNKYSVRESGLGISNHEQLIKGMK